MELSQREGNQRGQGIFDFNNSDQKVLSKAKVDKSAHTFSLSESFLIIWALTGKTTVPRDSCPWFDKTRTPNNIRGKVFQVYQGQESKPISPVIQVKENTYPKKISWTCFRFLKKFCLIIIQDAYFLNNWWDPQSSMC